MLLARFWSGKLRCPPLLAFYGWLRNIGKHRNMNAKEAPSNFILRLGTEVGVALTFFFIRVAQKTRNSPMRLFPSSGRSPHIFRPFSPTTRFPVKKKRKKRSRKRWDQIKDTFLYSIFTLRPPVPSKIFFSGRKKKKEILPWKGKGEENGKLIYLLPQRFFPEICL